MTQPPQYPFPPPDPHSGQPQDPYGTPPPSSGTPYQPGPAQDPHSVPGPPPEPHTGPPYDPHAAPGPPSGPPYDPHAGFPPAPGQHFAPTPPAPKRSNGPIIIGIAVGAVALMCIAAVFFALFVPGNGDGPPGSGDPSSGEEPSGEAGDVDDSITEEFDPDNVTFWDTYDGIAQEKLALEDGRFYPDEASDDARHTKASADPVYSDVDLDGDLDVAMTLQDTGEPGADEAWSSIHIWLWEDGEIVPVKEHASWQWDCVGSFELTPGSGDRYFEITRDAYNICEDPESETITITVEDETPVQLAGEHRGATETCWVSEDTEHYADLAGVSEPTLLPKSDAPALGDSSRQTKVEVAVEDWDSESFGGHVIVVVTWDDGEETCGWVPWEDYKDNA